MNIKTFYTVKEFRDLLENVDPNMKLPAQSVVDFYKTYVIGLDTLKEA